MKESITASRSIRVAQIIILLPAYTIVWIMLFLRLALCLVVTMGYLAMRDYLTRKKERLT